MFRNFPIRASIFLLLALTPSLALTQVQLIQCPASSNPFGAACEKSVVPLARYLTTIFASDSGAIEASIFANKTVAKELALPAFLGLREANIAMANKMIAANPDESQTYVYALRASNDSNVESLLAKAANAKLWGQVHRRNFGAAYQFLKMIPDTQILLIVPGRSTDAESVRLSLAITMALKRYAGADDVGAECSKLTLRDLPSRRPVCAKLGRKLLLAAETTLEINTAFDVLTNSSENKLEQQNHQASRNAWEKLADAVFENSPDGTTKRKAFLLRRLQLGEPQAMLETYAGIPNHDQQLLKLAKTALQQVAQR
jgi:hypothetical protein